MVRRTAVTITIVMTCMLGAQDSFSWGSLTHAFITKRIAAEGGAVLDNAIYGSTAPDYAYFMFGSPYQNYLADRAHVDFLRVWRMARGGPAYLTERAAAFGFVAHNVEDYTAHFMSLTLNPAGGYVLQKAAVLNELLEAYGAWQMLGLDGESYAALRAELSHNLIEFAGDLMVALYMDPGTGQLLSDAAGACCEQFPELITRAYAGNLVAFSNRTSIRLNQPEAVQILAGSEFMFRNGMIAYGNLFADNDPAAVVQNLVLYLQTLAALQGIQVEDPNLLALVLGAGVSVIQNDFANEVAATIPFASSYLTQQGISF